MDNVTSEIFAALENWKLDQARALLERDSHLLSDSDYARVMGQLHDRLDVNRLLNDLNNHVENKNYIAALQVLEDIQIYGTATTHPDYEHLQKKYRDFQAEHLEGMARGWVEEISEYLTDEEGELDLDEARRRLAEVDVLLKKINLLPSPLRKDYEPQILGKVSEYENKQKEAEFIDNIENANRAEYFAEAQKLLAEARVAGVPDKKLQKLQEQVEKNQKRAEGQSITFLSDPTKSEVQRIEGASKSAREAKEWRLAFNLAYHGSSTLGEPDSSRLLNEAVEYKERYLEQLPKDIDQQIAIAENRFELGEYEAANQALVWAKKFGMTPGKFDGKIDDYMDSVVLKRNPLGVIMGGADLATRIAELEPKIQKGIDSRKAAREHYARVGMMMASGTFSKTADAVGLLLQALEIDEKYQDAQTLLSTLAGQYAGSFNKIFEDQRARFDASVQEGMWGRAQRYLNAIQSLLQQAQEFLKNYPPRLADKNPLKEAIPLDQFAKDVVQRKADFEKLQSREKSANEKREALMQAFNAARNNLEQNRQGAIEKLLDEWASLTQREMDVNRVRRQVQVFWEQEYPWLDENVRKIQEVTNKSDLILMQALESVAGELEGRGQGLSKVEQTLAEYYGKLGNLKQRDDPFGAVDYYIKAEQHAKFANNTAGSSAYHQAIEDLKAELKDKGAVIDTRRALQNALKEKSYDEIEQILVDLSDDLKNDIEIKRLGKQARIALARFHHDRFLEECRLILSIQPRAGEKSDVIAPKDRDFEYARDLAVRALGHLKDSSDANSMHDLAIKYQAKEKESIEELDNYIKMQNYEAAKDLAKDFIDQKYPYIGTRMWKKYVEAQNLFKKWNTDNQDNWDTAKEKAEAIIGRIDLGDENAEAVFAQAYVLLEKCKSTYWRPEDFEKTIDKIINARRNAFSEATKQYAESKGQLANGEITQARDAVVSFPSDVPAQVEKSRMVLLNHLAKLIPNLTTLREELINAKKSLLHVMDMQTGRQPDDAQQDLLLKNEIDHKEIDATYDSLKNAAEAAKRFEGLLGIHDDTKGLLGDENSKQTELDKNDEFALFVSPVLRKLKPFKEEEDKYKYLNQIALFLRLDGDFENMVRDYKINGAQEKISKFSRGCPSSLSDLSGGFKNLYKWLNERKTIYEEMEKVDILAPERSFLPPSDADLNDALKTLASLDGMTLQKQNQRNRYDEIKSTNQSAKVLITDWERQKIGKLRVRIKEKRETFFSQNVVVGLGISALFLCVMASVLAYVATRPVPVIIATPTEVKATATSTPIPSTLVPTAVFTPTPLPTLSGMTMGKMYVRRWPSTSAEQVPPNAFDEGKPVDILRYCTDTKSDLWLVLDLDGYYGWVKLYEGSIPLISIGDNRTNPEGRLPANYQINCTTRRDEPIPGLPAPACGYWDCDY